MSLPSKEKLFSLVSSIPDPEIPVITIADLGILREIRIVNDEAEVLITPTYSGCPAMKQISDDISALLEKEGFKKHRVTLVFQPAWTTDWISDEAKEKLRAYGIAPPEKTTSDKNAITGKKKIVPCPRCRSENTQMISQFGSTACKALYKCGDCLEPFDYFKCH